MTVRGSQVDARLRVRPGTSILLDGKGGCTLVASQGVRLDVSPDVGMLICEFADWRHLRELVGSDAEGSQRIAEDLAVLVDRGLLVREGDEGGPESDKREQPSVKIDIENHLSLLKDAVRIRAYQRALDRAVGPTTCVLDLGAGTGILSLLAAAAGARRVVGIEARSATVDLAKALLDANRLGDKVCFIEALSTNVSPAQIGESPNLLVAELLGNGILDENVLEYTLDARNRLLAPNAQLIPSAIEIDLVAIDYVQRNSVTSELRAASEVCGFDLSPVGAAVKGRVAKRVERYNPGVHVRMSEPVTAVRLELLTMSDAAFVAPVRLTVESDGYVAGVLAYFRAFLDRETVLSNSPWSSSTHWAHLMFVFGEPVMVKGGQALDVRLVYNGTLAMSLDGNVIAGHGPAVRHDGEMRAARP